MRVVGYVSGPPRDGLDCDRPLLWLCLNGCGLSDQRHCGNHREDKCGPCSARYGRRVEAVAASGLGTALDRRRGGYSYLLTLTSPGDRAHRLPNGVQCPCTPAGGADLESWNPDASRCWNRLLTAVERHYGTRPAYFRAAEVQRRGALHHHALIHSPVPIRLVDLRALAVTAGYGHSVDLQPLDPSSRRAAGYVAKYVTKSATERGSVPWLAEHVDRRTGELTLRSKPTFRTWSMSQNWGLTMAVVRARAQTKALELKAQRQQLHDATILANSREPAAQGKTGGTSPPL